MADMHYSVGAVIEREGKYLLVDRKKIPLGFACPAGHVENGESPLNALFREVQEETGMEVKQAELLLEERVENNVCSRNVRTHYWYVYRCDVSGEPKLNEEEAKSISWYSQKQIRDLELEPVWKYFFEKLGIT